mgnify:CR=1 FL=1
MSSTLRLLLRNPVSAAGLAVLSVLVVLAALGPFVAPYGVNEVDVTATLQPPSAEHWFGTDDLGRDVLSRVILAARVAFLVSVTSVSIALVAGVTLGLLSGYFGRWADAVIMRVVDVLFAFPVLLLAIAIVAVLGRGVTPTTIAIGVVYTPIFARVTRASVLSVREEPYVRAAVALGARPGRVILTHVLPNVTAPIIVQVSLALALAILSEAALSFLGLGVQPPEASWGRMLFDGRGFVDYWWMSVFPGMAIFLTVLAFNLVGDGLRDVLDPRQRSAIESGSGR